MVQKYFSSELMIKQIQCYSCLYKAKGGCTPTRFKEDRLPVYKPGEKNIIQEILQDHFKSFEENYDTQYSGKYGKYRIIRIKEAVEKFIECGDYSKGVAGIKCTNPDCDHEYFRPFAAKAEVACKSWYLCPSSNQKRLLLFSEHLSENVLLKDASQLAEVFRRRVIKLFVEKGLLQKSFALKLLAWKHSGFSVDNSVPIPASSRKARINLSQYIVRHPDNPYGLLAEDPLRAFKRNNSLQDKIQ